VFESVHERDQNIFRRFKLENGIIAGKGRLSGGDFIENATKRPYIDSFGIAEGFSD
jgi:hypothetical protein